MKDHFSGEYVSAVSISQPCKQEYALYNGHLSWRRLRGVKVNPIYQENDSGRYGDGTDTQSDTSVPVGEIQIEMYESLPRHRLVRTSRSAPNLPHSSRGNVSGSTSGVEGEKFEVEEEDDDTLPIPVPSDDEDDVFDEENEDQETVNWVDGKVKERQMAQTSEAERGNRKQLIRQSGIDATSGDPDVIEIDSSPSVSGSSSPSLTSSCAPQKQKSSKMKRRATPRFFKGRNFLKKRQLSAVHEQASVAENEELAIEEDDNKSDAKELDDSVDTIIVPPNDIVHCFTGTRRPSDNGEAHSNVNILNDNCNNNLSAKNGYTSSVNNVINLESSLSSDSTSLKDEVIQFPGSKAMYSLDKIAMLPSYSHIHNTSPVGSFDYINNNNQAVPDLMLQHNGRMNGISRNGSINGFLKQGSGDEYITIDPQDLTAVYSLSTTSSLDSDKHKDANVTDCDCGGRPTLKCLCGRKTLQKLFGEKYVIKYREEDFHDNNFKSISEDIATIESNKTPIKSNNRINKPAADGSRSNPPESDISEITESPSEEIPVKKILTPLKPILHSVLSPKRTVSILERRGVTFSEDTVFNENKGVIYLKECISPSDLALLITELQNDDDGGLDNPAFEEWKDVESQMTDSKAKKKSKKNSKSKNKVASNDSLIMKVSDLNAPAYMQHYLNSVNARDEVSSPQCNGKKAPPVSIEAIGGTIIDDPANDEIGEACDEEFEEYRRRRKLKYGDNENVDKWMKKTSRKKKIKICVIIFAIIAIIITAIALAIHFGAPHAGSMSGGLSSSSGGGFPGMLM